MRQASAFSRRMAYEIQNSVSEENTGIGVFLPWPINSEWIIMTNLSSLLPEASSHALPNHPAFAPQPRLRRKLKKCGLLLTIIFLGSFHFTTMHMDLFAFQLCTYHVFISYMPRVNPSLLKSAGLLCICLLLGFLPSLKKPRELEHFIIRNMILKRIVAASSLRVNQWLLIVFLHISFCGEMSSYRNEPQVVVQKTMLQHTKWNI